MFASAFGDNSMWVIEFGWKMYSKAGEQNNCEFYFFFKMKFMK